MRRLLSIAAAAAAAGMALRVDARQLPARGAEGLRAAASTTTSVPPRQSPQNLMPGTRASAFTTIQGNALTSTNGVLPDSVVRLRDARYGRIVDVQLTDKSGLFAFRAVDPGMYVIEVVGNDQLVVAASQVLSVNAGDAVSAVVKLPWKIPPLGGLFGHTAPSAVAVSSAAAASGVLGTVVAGEPACGPAVAPGG